MINFLPNLLEGKKIILGVCGSIAAYKSLEILRLLQKLGANVRVVMSQNARNFIQPLAFEALSGHQVLHEDSQSWGDFACNHIELARWGDLFVIAPTTANTLNKLSIGFADNVLLETFLAFNGKKLIAPCANTRMIENPITIKSLQSITGVSIISPQVKKLACKEIGNGALAEPIEIVYGVLRECFKDSFWENKKVCISGGGSKERIDDVRYLSNFSSGKMGSALALSAYFLGADVCYIHSTSVYPLPINMQKIEVQDTQGYLKAIQSWQMRIQERKNAFLIMNAAISDYIPQTIFKEKLKKQMLGSTWNLPLKENIDILKSIDKSQITIGFKLENAKNALENAKATLDSKSLDAICLNVLSEDFTPMESEQNEVFWISKDRQKKIHTQHKMNLAFEILNQAKDL